ncbi:MAG: response regulator transcription factor [Chloroflexi bacterium]|nr:response regulator transcription factor [Chloroflexota bacterium]
MSALSPTQPSEITARLLVVDDDNAVRAPIAKLLRLKGYQVDEAATGEIALKKIEGIAYDLMLLDLILPGMSGVALMRHARALRRDLLMIVLTAHASAESAITAVKIGAVDYLLKPCKSEDLFLVISKALQERAQQQRRQTLLSMIGDVMEQLREPENPPTLAGAPLAAARDENLLELDHTKRIVTIKTDPPYCVELTEGEVSILVALMNQPNQVLSCNQIAATALGYQNMDKWTVENVIRSAVFRLRQKLEAGPNAPELIRTVRGRGYFYSPA